MRVVLFSALLVRSAVAQSEGTFPDLICSAGYSGTAVVDATAYTGGCVACGSSTYQGTAANGNTCNAPGLTIKVASTAGVKCAAGFSGVTADITYTGAGEYDTGCTVCDAGKYQNAAGQVACHEPAEDAVYFAATTTSVKCAKGYELDGTGFMYDDSTGAYVSGCVACSGIEYQGTAGGGSCHTPIASDPFVRDTAIGVKCAAGYSGDPEAITYDAAGAYGSGCTECATGQYQNAAGQTTCNALGAADGTAVDTAIGVKCAAGFSGATAAITYEAGAYASGCTACGAEEYLQAEGQSQCHTPVDADPFVVDLATTVKCAPGYRGATAAMVYDATGAYASGCTACAPGQYQNVAGKESCNAIVGIAIVVDSTTAVKCAAGFSGDTAAITYTTAGAYDAGCAACDAGKYQAAAGQASCNEVVADGEVIVDSTKTVECAPGFKMVTTITYDAGGAYEIGCATCGTNEYQASAGLSSCHTLIPTDPFMIDTTTTVKCVAGFSGVTAAIVYGAETGDYQSGCTECPMGQYVYTAGQATCNGAVAGTMVDTTTTVKCAAGFSGATAAITYDDAGAYAAGCAECAEGQYQNIAAQATCHELVEATVFATTETVKCAAGYRNDGGIVYTPSTGAYASGCSACASGQYQHAEGQTGCNLIVAGDGTAAETPSTVICGAGFSGAPADITYSAAGAYSGGCTICAGGQYQHADGQVRFCCF
jgi:hypothetical protein